MKHLRYLLFIVLAAALLPCVAQKRDINLTLHVTAPGGVSASDAHVVLRHVGYSLSYGRITLDSEGTTVVRVYAGEHSLEVSKSGYVTHTSTFTVESDMSVDVVLEEETLKPFSLSTSVAHDVHTGLNDITLSWNREAPVFFDDFESYEAFSINFGEWTGIDGDGLISAPLLGSYLNRSVRNYGQIMNPKVVEPAWWNDYPVLRAYSGDQYVGFVRTLSGDALDDWLISPPVTPGKMHELSFMGKAGDQYFEKFQVYVTEVLDNPGKGDFTMINEGNYELADYRGWKRYSYDLSPWQGKTIKFAIRCISEYNSMLSFMFMVDDVRVGQPLGVSKASRRAHRVARSPLNPNEHFRLLLNDEEVGQTEDYEYTFEGLPAGTYKLGVQAVYAASQTDVVETTVVIEDNNVALTVNVSTNNGENVNGQRVSLYAASDDLSFDAIIEDGKAYFASVPPGDYIVSVDVKHYDLAEESINLEENATVDIELKETLVDPYNITVDMDAEQPGNALVKWNQNLSFQDSFEDYEDFAVSEFGDWRSYDLDQHNVYPIGLGSATNIVTFPGASTPTAPQAIAPMVFNPYATVPAMAPSDVGILAPTGIKTVIFFSPQQSNADKWLVSPEMAIRDGFVCRFTAKAYSTYVESMELRVFLNGDDNPWYHDSYELSTIESLPSNQWTIYETPLDQFVGQTIRLAVHYTSYDAFMAQLDDFYVGNLNDDGSAVDVGKVDHYEVWLDGTLVGTTSDPWFTLTDLEAGEHTVGVAAVYTSGSSDTALYTFNVSSGIHDVRLAGDDPIVGYYNLSGQPVSGTLPTGIYIARTASGAHHKVLVK
ncbi:MAG: choice-of-anchor J domain-containing protein [Muribaculaceae bacterium]|nr:choice-of-anchor J domain-containing protein [Muribaculaceae bacterium]